MIGGGAPIGAGSLIGGGPLLDPPTVTVTTIGTVSSGGPDVTVAWVYNQAQSSPQSEYRLEFLDDALATTYWDSGWILGATSSRDIDFDAEGIPHESTDITARVSIRGLPEIGQGTVARYEASDTDPFIVQFGEPHCTITTPPDMKVFTSASAVSVGWNFTDDRAGKTQSAYKVDVVAPASGVELFSTGWVTSTDTSTSLSYAWQDGSDYDIRVQLKNDQGIRSD